MFREVTRKKQRLTQEQCIEILKRELRGVLCVMGDDEYPYGVPMNHFYDERDGAIYFHSGKFGHRFEALHKHNKVCFTVLDQPRKEGEHWAYIINSVIVFGKIEFVEDTDRIIDYGRRFSAKFTDDQKFIEDAIERSTVATCLMKLVPEHITGKRVVED